jgi:hypothetical protein
MKLMVSHDRRGNMTAIVASPDSPVGRCTVLRPGQRVTEIEVPEITLDLGPKQILERLSDLMQTHKIELEGVSYHLTKKIPRKEAKPTRRQRAGH